MFHETVERVYDLILESIDRSAAKGFSATYELPRALFRDGAPRVANRPLPWLTLPVLTCEALDGDREAAYYVAAAWEVTYRTAGYLDEWQDQDTDDALWRSIGAEQTVNLAFGLTLLSYSILGRLQELNVPAITIVDLHDEFSQTALEMVAGQDAELRGDLSLDEYQDVASAKTGSQWRLATKSGALVAGAAPKVTAQYGEFGHALGLLFQAWNDLRGSTGADGKRDLEYRRSLPVLAAEKLEQDHMLDTTQKLVGGQLYTIVQIEMLHQQATEALGRCPAPGRLSLFLDALSVQKVLGHGAQE